MSISVGQEYVACHSSHKFEMKVGRGNNYHTSIVVRDMGRGKMTKQILLSGKIQINHEAPVHVRYINVTLVVLK